MKKKTSLFKRIVSVFDKYIVIPITRIVLRITRLFDSSSHWFETFLSKQTTLLFLSLFLALGLYIFVDSKLLAYNNRSAEVFRDQKVEVLYDDERFALEGVPETADITLMGNKADLYIARQQQANHSVTIDLNNITEPGTYEVELKYNSGDLKSIETSVNPSKTTVVVHAKQTENRNLTYSVINTNHLDSTISVEKVTLNIDQVFISGAGYKVDQVAIVEALIDVDKLKSKKSGKQTFEDITLRAYDADGNVVDVEISYKVKPVAEVTLSSSSRTVPLNFVIDKALPFGKAIESYTFSRDTVTVYGSKEALDTLATEGIDIKFDASNLTKDYSGTVEIPMPNGITKMDTNRVDIDIKVTSSVSSSDYNLTIKVDKLNEPDGYHVGPNSDADVEVLIRPTCAEKVCKALSSADLEVYIDLSSLAGKKEGVYELPVQVRPRTANARLTTFVISPEKVKVKLMRD